MKHGWKSQSSLYPCFIRVDPWLIYFEYGWLRYVLDVFAVNNRTKPRAAERPFSWRFAADNERP